jgi:hypothetical protein
VTGARCDTVRTQQACANRLGTKAREDVRWVCSRHTGSHHANAGLFDHSLPHITGQRIWPSMWHGAYLHRDGGSRSARDRGDAATKDRVVSSASCNTHPTAASAPAKVPRAWRCSAKSASRWPDLPSAHILQAACSGSVRQQGCDALFNVWDLPAAKVRTGAQEVREGFAPIGADPRSVGPPAALASTTCHK